MERVSPLLGPLSPFDTRGLTEKRNLATAFNRPFSGYLGGLHNGGYWVSRLEDEWKSTFRINNAIPCNSATSGLLAACIAIGISPGDEVWCPVYTMSATASCARILGANVKFFDIEPVRFSMNMNNLPGGPKPKAIIVTNLFGHPAYLEEMRSWCNANKVMMIEDNAQSPFATTNGKYSGTIGHIGVFSLNVHKHMQTGEGGIVVTNESDLALHIRDAINHGELRTPGIMGLNLRMTEQTAALAVAQLNKGHSIIADRRELALEITSMVKDIPFVLAPEEAIGCRHVYYQWAARIYGWKRGKFIATLAKHGLPMCCGYSPLLSTIFKSSGNYPVAEKMEYEELVTFEICSYSPTNRQRKIMRDIFKIAGDET